MLLEQRLASDPDFLKKLPLYKTAWSPTYRTYVALLGVTHDRSGEPILIGQLACTTNNYLFRVEELADFCL